MPFCRVGKSNANIEGGEGIVLGVKADVLVVMEPVCLHGHERIEDQLGSCQ